MSFTVSFDQAPSQRLHGRDGRIYWIVIRRGNDLDQEYPSMLNGVSQLAWTVRTVVRRIAWMLDGERRTWRVLQFEAPDGYRDDVPSRAQEVATWEGAVRLAEAWRDERS